MKYAVEFKWKTLNIVLESNEFGLVNLDFRCLKEKTKSNEILNKTLVLLNQYFSGEKPDFNILPFSLSGTKFQMDVWRILTYIPYGTVVTYNDIAKELAAKYGVKKMSAQAVGQAVTHNPLPIIIPCHRVVGSNNGLGGYSKGIELKKRLLKIEGIDLSKYKSNKKSL